MNNVKRLDDTSVMLVSIVGGSISIIENPIDPNSYLTTRTCLHVRFFLWRQFVHYRVSKLVENHLSFCVQLYTINWMLI